MKSRIRMLGALALLVVGCDKKADPKPADPPKAQVVDPVTPVPTLPTPPPDLAGSGSGSSAGSGSAVGSGSSAAALTPEQRREKLMRVLKKKPGRTK